MANFASALAGADNKVPTIASKLAAIRFFHRGAGQENPTDNAGVSEILKGIRRTLGTAPRQKPPATVDVIRALMARIAPDTLQGKRDRTLLLLGFAGAFRRYELVAITVEDLTFSEEGVDVFLPNSKTDQEAKGQSVAVLTGKALKPADRFREWLEASRVAIGGHPPPDQPWRPPDGAADRSDGGADREALRRGGWAGFREAIGHSLRAGFVTSAAENRASISRKMEAIRHRVGWDSGTP